MLGAADKPIMPSVVVSECRYAEWRYADCLGALQGAALLGLAANIRLVAFHQ